MPALATAAGASRPRVEGERESEILDATVRLLVDVGYDRLTLDAVAAEARASKARVPALEGEGRPRRRCGTSPKACDGPSMPIPATSRCLMAMACSPAACRRRPLSVSLV